MLHDYEAARELRRVEKLHAFNLPTATARRKINQHAALYDFADGSRLLIYSTRGRADAWHMGWKGTAQDTHLGPIKGAALLINKQGR